MAVRPIDGNELLKKFAYSPADTEDEQVFNTAVRKIIREAPTLTPQNELLTIDDLLDMSHTPIWVMDTTVNRGEWCYWKDGRAYSCESHPEYYDLEDYGKWTAYRQSPRGCRYGRNML